MSQIKLLILLLINLILFSCANQNKINSNYKFSLGYIEGGYDGLIMSNLIRTYLKSYNLLDKKSELKIELGFGHSDSIFITNIDNTSDRQKISSDISIKIYDRVKACQVYFFSDKVSQFYIFAPSEKFISNEKAVKKIKLENSEQLVKKFINNILYKELGCE
tara:strand:+ start:460 stop:945 length:486 start_codon:yes stop_codon:yes gene_type:complete